MSGLVQMRIAVCFSGMVRTSKYVTPNLLNYFGDLLPNIDFFMHTWDITQPKLYTPGSMGLITSSINQSTRDPSYPIISVMTNDYKNFKKIKVESFSEQCEIYRYFPLWYSWVNSITLKEEYEKEYNFTYDVVLKMRPDMIFPEGSTLQKEIDNFLNNPELFYVMGGNSERLNDVYFLSTSKNMNIATKIIDNSIPWKDNEFNIHLTNNSIKYARVRNPSYAIYREECVGVSPMDWLGCHMIETYYYSEKKTFDMYCTTQPDFLHKFLELYEFLIKKLKMKLINRTTDVITNSANLEDLHTVTDVPILMSCTIEEESTDIKKDLVWQISKDSGIIQLKNLIPLDVLYSTPHSGTTGGMWLQHHQEFSKFLNKFNPISVLEIGGAHGILATDYLKNNTIPWTIIEPNPFPVDNCPAKFIKGFFDDKFLVDEKFDTIVHSHVFEHVYDPNEFMQTISNIIHTGNKLIFTLPNMQTMLENKYTNCINFEHTIFLTEPYIEYLLAKFGFKIIEKAYFNNHSIFYSTVRDDTVIPFELDVNLYDKNKQIYLNYVKYYEDLIIELNNKLKDTTLPIYLFGAHVFSQYLLAVGLDSTKINSVLDNDTKKQNKRLYGTSLRIQSPHVLKNGQAMVVILKAGIYNEEIKQDILKNINPNIIFWE